MILSTQDDQEKKPINYLLILLRLVALLMLAFSVGYWAKLVGLSDAAVRFDTLPNAWKVAATALVVLQPVTALGLWGGWHWGIVLWILVALIEFSMYGLNPAIFGQSNMLLVFHAAGLATYVVMLLLLPKLQKPQSNE